MQTCTQEIIDDEEYPFDLDEDFDYPAVIKPPRYVYWLRGVNFTYPNPSLFQSDLNSAILNKLNEYYCHDISNLEKFNLSGIRNLRIKIEMALI